MSDNNSDRVRDTVREGYAEIARSGLWSDASTTKPSGCCAGGGCCGPATATADQIAEAVGYSDEELAALPEGANMGLSCGNPTALASLREGEVVLDLGSGGGLDCFIAGKRVGEGGRVIGVDMTAEMVGKARRGIASYRAAGGLDNVEFRLGEIEHLPVADESVDVVISNCVINLSPDKPQVWREIARILKPGGRVAISDLVLLRPLPQDVRDDLEALVGCIAGASHVDEVREMAAGAGLTDLEIATHPEYVRSLESVKDPLYQRIADRLGEGLGAYVTSASITATKPCCACGRC